MQIRVFEWKTFPKISYHRMEGASSRYSIFHVTQRSLVKNLMIHLQMLWRVLWFRFMSDYGKAYEICAIFKATDQLPFPPNVLTSHSTQIKTLELSGFFFFSSQSSSFLSNHFLSLINSNMTMSLKILFLPQLTQQLLWFNPALLLSLTVVIVS